MPNTVDTREQIRVPRSTALLETAGDDPVGGALQRRLWQSIDGPSALHEGQPPPQAAPPEMPRVRYRRSKASARSPTPHRAPRQAMQSWYSRRSETIRWRNINPSIALLIVIHRLHVGSVRDRYVERGSARAGRAFDDAAGAAHELRDDDVAHPVATARSCRHDPRPII